MKIECLLKRDGGSFVSLGSKTYHFSPYDTGRHVADVENEAHVERLLSITEGYRVAAGTKPAALTAAGITTAPPLSTIAPAATDPDAEAARQAALHAAGADAARQAALQAAAKAEAAAKQTAAGTAPDELEAAKAAYIEKFGKKPHHTWSADVIRKKIAEG